MWIKYKDRETDKIYYYNDETEERTYTKPKDGFRLYHILVKHCKSRNPVNRTEEEALEKIKNIFEHLKKNINDPEFRNLFKSIALESSDCSSAKRGGDLGFVCKNEMYKEFEKAAFILKRGRIVGPVITPSGYHIIYRR